MHVKIMGTIVAPEDLDDWEYNEAGESTQWLAFRSVDDLFIHGSGTIDGRGAAWWDRPCSKEKRCKRSPTALIISQSNNLTISGLHITNSPQAHIALEGCTSVLASRLNIASSRHSPNTDGIHVQNSRYVHIVDSSIASGDDCISIGSGTAWLEVTGVACGPGHGISIGSLGSRGHSDWVEHVHVSRCSFTGTTNGARIKTKPGGRGYARNIVFEHIHVSDVKYPIIIDQYYYEKHRNEHRVNDKETELTAVKVSNVTYRHFNGTSNGQTAVNFDCSDAVPCTGIMVQDIHIAHTAEGDSTSSYCENTKGYFGGIVMPRVSCLAAMPTWRPPWFRPRPEGRKLLTMSLPF